MSKVRGFQQEKLRIRKSNKNRRVAFAKMPAGEVKDFLVEEAKRLQRQLRVFKEKGRTKVYF